MGDLSVHYKSDRHDWGTPQAFFDEWHRRFALTVDAAAHALNHKLPRWYGPGGEREDALAAPRDPAERYWCNPPYGKMQRAFVERGREHAIEGGLSVFLLPARTDTRLFHDVIQSCHLATVTFIRWRLTFEGAVDPAPFPSMVVVFNGAR